MGKLEISIKKDISYYLHNPFSKNVFYVIVDGEVHEVSTKENGKTFELSNEQHEITVMCPTAFGAYAVNNLPDGHPLKKKYAKLLKTTARANEVGKNAAMNLGGSALSAAMIGMAYDKISAKPANGLVESGMIDFAGKSHTLTVNIKKKAKIKKFIFE